VIEENTMGQLLLYILILAYRVINIALWAYVILSWFYRSSAKLYNIYMLLSKYIEPVLRPLRKLLMPISYKIGIDFTVYAAMLILQFAYRVLYNIITLIF